MNSLFAFHVIACLAHGLCVRACLCACVCVGGGLLNTFKHICLSLHRLETEQNPWVCLTSALLTHSSSFSQINIGNEVLTMCRSLYPTKHKLNPQVRLWVSSSPNIDGMCLVWVSLVSVALLCWDVTFTLHFHSLLVHWEHLLSVVGRRSKAACSEVDDREQGWASAQTDPGSDQKHHWCKSHSDCVLSRMPHNVADGPGATMWTFFENSIE